MLPPGVHFARMPGSRLPPRPSSGTVIACQQGYEHRGNWCPPVRNWVPAGPPW